MKRFGLGFGWGLCVLGLAALSARATVINNSYCLDVPEGESVTLSGTNNYSGYVKIDGALIINGAVYILTPYFFEGLTGSINGNARGYLGGAGGYTLGSNGALIGEGPEGGLVCGGYTTTYGTRAYKDGGDAGHTYGTISGKDWEMGSGGGGGGGFALNIIDRGIVRFPGGNGGAGGASLRIEAITARFYGDVSVMAGGGGRGTHFSSTGDPDLYISGDGGNGSGGTVLIDSFVAIFDNESTISAGNGRVKFFSNYQILQGSLSTNNGSYYESGEIFPQEWDLEIIKAGDGNSNGIPDGYEDYDRNGILEAFEDFNGDGVPDAFEDFNSNDTPDAFEDFNSNGASDAFEDFNGNGMPDTFESKNSSVPFDTGTSTFGAMGVRVFDNSNLFVPVSGSRVYHGSSFNLDWSSFLSSHFEAGGVLYRVGHDPDAQLDTDNYGGYLSREQTQSLDVNFSSNACYYVHLAPIFSATGFIDRDHETVIRIMRDERAPFVRSPTNPNQMQWYVGFNSTLEFLPFHIDGSSVLKFFYEWDHVADTEPTTNSSLVATYSRAFVFQPDGTYYFHVRSQDLAGSLSETAHFRVNIGAPAAPIPGFSGTPVSGLAPLPVQFTDESLSQVDSYAWDFDNDGMVDSTDQNPSYTYNAAGTFSVKLTVTGEGGSESLVKTNYVTATMPSPPTVAFSESATNGPAPLNVSFTDQSTGAVTAWAWDFDNDGVVDSTEQHPTFAYVVSGLHSVKLTITGPGGSDSMVKADLVSVENGYPVVEVASQQIYLDDLGAMAVLDASPSSDINGDALFFSWREFYGNPYHGLIPIASESLSKINLYFPAPGRYQYEVRVSDGQAMSTETRTITVYVPGRKGILGFSPSDGVVRVPDGKIRVHNTAADAQNNVNLVDVAITDSLGQYFLENVAPENSTTAKTYWYKMERAGFVSSEALQMTVRPDPGYTDDRQDESLGRGSISTVSGSVKTAGGSPIEGALVSIIPGLGGTVYGDSTDSSGNFQLSTIPKGSWIMQLRAAGYQPEVRDINVADGMVALHFTLKPATQTGSLAGTVHLNGTDEPVEGVKVSLGTGAETYTDQNGDYGFTSLPTGQYIVMIAQSGYESKRLPNVAVAAGSNTLDIPISFASRGPTLLGTVTDIESGQPIRLATVGIVSGSTLIRSDITDYTGYWQIRDVPTGSQTFRITAPGYLTKTFDYEVANGLNFQSALTRNPFWTAPSNPVGALPVADVVVPFIYPSTMLDSFTLDATASSGSNLRYIWRENPDNPQFGLIPAGSETMSQIVVSGVDEPGIYRFELQVKSGELLSDNTAVITVFAPGLAGNVHASPSDGVFGLNLATVRVYNNYDDALHWRVNGNLLESSQTADSPMGNFKMDNLSPGSYWVVARAQTGSGYNQYGPVRRRVNYSSAARKTKINMPRNEYQFSGTIKDASTSATLENVRVVMTPGSLSESFRTTTDSTGAFRLSSVPQGSGQMVLLMKQGYTTKIVYVDISANTVQNMTLTENTAGTLADLSGRIVANYQGELLPIPYAEVIIGAGLAKTLTDGDGYYQINNLPPGAYYGTIRKNGYIPQGLADFGFVVLNAGANEISKTLAFDGNGPVVRGVVVDESRTVVPGVTVTILPPIGAFSFASMAKMVAMAEGEPVALSDEGSIEQSDEGGIFQLVGVPHGERQVLLTFPDGSTVTNTVYVGGNMEVVFVVQADAASNDDTDGDGMSDSWELEFFGSATGAGASADADLDGQSNLDEYIAGTIPTNAASRFAMEPVQQVPEGFVVKWNAVDGRVYDVLWTPSLDRGFQLLGIGLAAPINSYTDTVHMAESSGFYMVAVRKPGNGDADADGLSDAWETAYFADSVAAVAAYDFDGDGQSNIEEYIAGTDPTNSVSVFSVSSSTAESGGVLYNVVSWISVSNRTYSVLWSPELGQSFRILETGLEFPQNSYTDTLHSAESQGYYKVDVRLK